MARNRSRGCGCGLIWGILIWAMIILVGVVGLSFTEAFDFIGRTLTVLWFVFLAAVALGILYFVGRVLFKVFGRSGGLDLDWGSGSRHDWHVPPLKPRKPRGPAPERPRPLPPGTYMDGNGTVRCSRCYGRQVFRTEHEARAAADQAAASGERFDVYYEEECRLWHLGPD